MPKHTTTAEPLSYDDDYDVLQGRLSALRRHHPGQDHSALEAHIKAMKLARHIRRVLEQAPPLSREQRVYVARVLRDAGTRP